MLAGPACASILKDRCQMKMSKHLPVKEINKELEQVSIDFKAQVFIPFGIQSSSPFLVYDILKQV